MHRPIKDQIKDLYENYHIAVKSLNTVKKITMHTPKASGSVYGNLGYFFTQGQAKDTTVNQLLAQVKKRLSVLISGLITPTLPGNMIM